MKSHMAGCCISISPLGYIFGDPPSISVIERNIGDIEEELRTCTSGSESVQSKLF
jgi:hypothetical protein